MCSAHNTLHYYFEFICYLFDNNLRIMQMCRSSNSSTHTLSAINFRLSRFFFRWCLDVVSLQIPRDSQKQCHLLSFRRANFIISIFSSICRNVLAKWEFGIDFCSMSSQSKRTICIGRHMLFREYGASMAANHKLMCININRALTFAEKLLLAIRTPARHAQRPISKVNLAAILLLRLPFFHVFHRTRCAVCQTHNDLFIYVPWIRWDKRWKWPIYIYWCMTSAPSSSSSRFEYRLNWVRAVLAHHFFLLLLLFSFFHHFPKLSRV